MTTPRMSTIEGPKRGLSRVQAANYIGVSASKFDEMVKDGRMPESKQIDARRVWDRVALDLAFEDLPDNPSSQTTGWEDIFDEAV